MISCFALCMRFRTCMHVLFALFNCRYSENGDKSMTLSDIVQLTKTENRLHISTSSFLFGICNWMIIVMRAHIHTQRGIDPFSILAQKGCNAFTPLSLKLTPTAACIFYFFAVLHRPFFYHCVSSLSYPPSLSSYFSIFFFTFLISFMLLGFHSSHRMYLSVLNCYYCYQHFYYLHSSTQHIPYDIRWYENTHTFEVRIGSAKLSRVYWSFLGIVKYITTAIEVTTKRLNQEEVEELQRQLQKNLFSHFASQMQEKLMATDEQTTGIHMRV